MLFAHLNLVCKRESFSPIAQLFKKRWFHCLCPLPASRKGLRLPLRSALFGERGRDWRPWLVNKAFQLDIYFLEAIWSSILGLTISKTTLNYMKNTWMQYLATSFFGDIYLKYLRIWFGCEFWKRVFKKSSRTYLMHGIAIWALVWLTYLAQLSSKNRQSVAVFFIWIIEWMFL